MITSRSLHMQELGDGTDIASLRAALHGELILPGDAAPRPRFHFTEGYK